MTIKTHNPQLENIKIEGRTGTWYVIDIIKHEGETYYRLESEQHGDEADWIIAWHNDTKFEEEQNEELCYYLLFER